MSMVSTDEVISNKDWTICADCGAVVKTRGYNHMEAYHSRRAENKARDCQEKKNRMLAREMEAEQERSNRGIRREDALAIVRKEEMNRPNGKRSS